MRKSLGLVVITLITDAALAYLMFGHWQYAPNLTNIALLHTLLFVHLAFKVTAAQASRHHEPDPDFDYNSLQVDVVVPIYNEDPDLLAAGIHALAAQDRLPDQVWLIDDGSQNDGEDFHILEEAVVEKEIQALRALGVLVHAIRRSNRGKRWAQQVAFRQSEADVLVTIDSDTYLDPEAIGKLLIPFSRPDVMSVAGLACGQNYRKNPLTRAIDLGFTMSFLQGRLAEACFGQVRVNCGILAAYRGDVVRDNLPRYLNQQFFGATVKAGDDRALTYFAKERGRTECQIEAVAYSAQPESINHLTRQRLRWARSWCWGTLLLLRRPVTSADFWFTLTQLVGIIGFGILLVLSLVGTAIGAVSPWLLFHTMVVIMSIGSVMHLRYLALAHRSDPLFQRLLTWLMSPVATLLYIGITLPLYYVAMLRPRPQRTWGTRRKVEVRLHRPTSVLGAGREAA